jgi:hypothetical protein
MKGITPLSISVTWFQQFADSKGTHKLSPIDISYCGYQTLQYRPSRGAISASGSEMVGYPCSRRKVVLEVAPEEIVRAARSIIPQQ